MSDDIRFRSDIVVEPVPDGCCGSDQLIAHAAWVEPPGRVSPDRNDTPDGWRRLIRGMLKHGHTSPEEQGRMTVHVEAPGVVWWQWTRQRFQSLDTEDFSPNIESGRYRVLDGVFYIPPFERPLFEGADFKPLRPVLESHRDAGEYANIAGRMKQLYTQAWREYRHLTERPFPVAREVARLVLPNWALYCSGYVGAGPLSWLQFFSKRVKAGGGPVTFPQSEIEQAARRCEELFAERWPITHEEWVNLGRRV